MDELAVNFLKYVLAGIVLVSWCLIGGLLGMEIVWKLGY